MIKKLAILMVITILLTSCGYTPDDYLAYQNFPIELDAVMTFGGEKYDVFISVTGICEGSIVYKTPLTLAGYRYDIANDEVTMSYERLTVKLTDGHPSKTAINMFTLTPENMISAEVTDHGGLKLNRVEYNHGGSIVTVWCTTDNIPVRMETHEIKIDIINFRGNPSNE
jgi:hypothetical protein